MPGGPWTLKQINGKEFTHLNLRGYYYLLFFGHTFEPDVTPLTMLKIIRAIRELNSKKEHQYIACKAVFVTTQPDTDTPKYLKNFNDLFNSPDLIVLTADSNSDPNLIKMMRSFKVPIGLSPEEI